MLSEDEKKINISARGYSKGLRGVPDGITFFGFNAKDQNGVLINDIILKKVKESTLERVFFVQFLEGCYVI